VLCAANLSGTNSRFAGIRCRRILIDTGICGPSTDRSDYDRNIVSSSCSMAHKFTKRNHYNPCFWTALWNEDYFSQYSSGSAQRGSPRDQVVHVLNMRSAKVLPTTVEKVHYHKDLGVAEIDAESAKRFCARWYPEKYQSMVEYVTAHPEKVYLDFEDTLTGMEALRHYDSWMRSAKLGDIQSFEDKSFLAAAFMIHAMRSYEYMSSAMSRISEIGIDKWEYFWRLKNVWGNQQFLMRATIVPALAHWTLWRTRNHTFPLCDSPVMIDRDSVMVTLSPRLLVEIDLNVSDTEPSWVVREGIPDEKLAEFRLRSVNATFKEIIFHEEHILRDWLASAEVAARVASLRDPARNQECMRQSVFRINYGLGGFGRVPKEFESQLPVTFPNTHLP
jgi:hypothetical protein